MNLRDRLSNIYHISFSANTSYFRAIHDLDVTGAVTKRKQLETMLALCEVVSKLEEQQELFAEQQKDITNKMQSIMEKLSAIQLTATGEVKTDDTKRTKQNTKVS